MKSVLRGRIITCIAAAAACATFVSCDDDKSVNADKCEAKCLSDTVAIVCDEQDNPTEETCKSGKCDEGICTPTSSESCKIPNILCGEQCLDALSLHIVDCLSCSTNWCDTDNNILNGCEANVKGSDINNCGACGHKCDPGQTCENGTCKNTCNATTEIECGGQCYNINDLHIASCTTCAENYCDSNNNILDGCDINAKGSDVNNCGSCGHKCDTGETCTAGTCGGQTGPKCNAATEVECGGQCYNKIDLHIASCTECEANWCDSNNNITDGCDINAKGTDTDNCGTCGHKCDPGQVCSAGSCSSECLGDGEEMCGTSCVNVMGDDKKNCGACGQTCAGQCYNGECFADCTGNLNRVCNGVCTSINTNDNCGACGQTCDGQCKSGHCCASNEKLCGSVCVNTQGSDANNCGKCGNKCEEGEYCEKGECKSGSSTTCNASTEIECGGKCYNKNNLHIYACTSCYTNYCDTNNNFLDGCEVNAKGNDVNNCGSCGHKCDTGETCENGVCKGGTLVYPACNYTSDCNANETCVSGTCKANTVTCNTSIEVKCDNACYNKSNLHITSCTACAADWCDTDNNILNGCESNAKGNDANNCGSCGNKCADGVSCVNGVCDPTCVNVTALNTCVKVGDTVKFGSYYQDADGKSKTPLDWYVWRIDETQVILVTKYIIENTSFDRINYSSYSLSCYGNFWKASVIRSWLNGYDKSQNEYGISYNGLINELFNSNEIKVINQGLISTLPASNNYSKQGNATYDKVFLLQESDLTDESVPANLKKAYATPYVIAVKDLPVTTSDCLADRCRASYLLRTMSSANKLYYYSDKVESGLACDASSGVRPAIAIKR